VANADAIAATPGIDMLFVGIHDLAVECGAGGDIEHPDVITAIETVAGAAKRHGKLSGIGGIPKDALMRRCIDMGMRFIHCGNDFSFMMGAARQRAEAFRKL
jgi:2-keto-3-deoxy-L-rhamnonate aldolase RhmA